MHIFLRNSEYLDWIARVGDLLALQSVVFELLVHGVLSRQEVLE
jgi:hypothetical protein